MDIPAQTPSIGQDSDRRWLWAARLTALAAMVPLLLLMFVAPAFAIFLLPYWWSAACLFIMEPTRGLAVAVGVAPVGLATVGLATLTLAVAAGGGVALAALVVALPMAALLLSALKASSAVRHDPAVRKVFRRRAWYWRSLSILFWVLFAPVVIPYLGVDLFGPHGFASADANAASTLRWLNTHAVEYQLTYKNGYPPSLAVLGPPPPGARPNCKNADLIDPGLARGKSGGYVIQYNPGPPIETPPMGCPAGATSYTITARPLKYEKTGIRSFLIDESGVIRATAENRAATAQDPPL